MTELIRRLDGRNRFRLRLREVPCYIECKPVPGWNLPPSRTFPVGYFNVMPGPVDTSGDSLARLAGLGCKWSDQEHRLFSAASVEEEIAVYGACHCRPGGRLLSSP